jgi:predicted nicotinamide N-methyase
MALYQRPAGRWCSAAGCAQRAAGLTAAAGLPPGAASDLAEETFVLAGRAVRVLRPRDADAVLEDVLAEKDPSDDRLPFWAELWPSGVALARALGTRRLAGRRVLELGCGLGLVAVTAALAGARVLAVDRSPEATAFAAANAAHNGVTLQVAVCAFEEPGPLLAGAPWDLVLAADVLYEPRNVPVLLGLLPRLVDDGGEVWLADPGRQMLDPFLAGLAEAGWRCQRLGGDPATVAVHRLVRRAPARGDGHG